ncbi:hypothetical protein F4803DRAFT_540906 [Xylaria telfairii]|nr:hypothetical protein F4803DRAFT_540906 [Xylaria telfairii]
MFADLPIPSNPRKMGEASRDQSIDIREQTKVGVAAHDVKVENLNNTFESRNQPILATQVEDIRQWNNVTHVNSTVNYNSTPPIRAHIDDYPVHFILNRSGDIAQDDPYVWNPGLGRISSIEDLDKAQSEIHHRWTQAIPRVKQLKDAVILFHFRYKQSTKDEILSWSSLQAMKNELVDLVGVTRKHYRQHYRIQDKTSSALISMEDQLPQFFSWVDSLYSDDFRFCLGAAIKSFLQALMIEDDGDRPEAFAIEYIAKVFSMFRSAKEYIDMTPSHRGQMSETIELFECCCDFFTKLFLGGGTGFRGNTKKETQLAADSVNNRIICANDRAKSWNRLRQTNGKGFMLADTSKGGFLNSLLQTLLLQMLSQRSYGPNEAHGPTPNEKIKELREGGEDSLTMSELLQYLPFDLKMASQDAERCLPHNSIEKAHMQRLINLVTGDIFRDWVKRSDKSSALLVHGNLEPGTLSSITPLSHLCAQIVKEFSNQQNVIVLSYFCGFHARPRDKDANAASMLCQLIGQLLTHPLASAANVIRSIDVHHLKKIKSKDLGVLRQVFSSLIHHLQTCQIIIICILDSISFYEINARLKNTQKVLKTLMSVVRMQQQIRGRDTNMVLKLMITDAARSKRAYELFKADERIDMRAAGGDVSSNPRDLVLKR